MTAFMKRRLKLYHAKLGTICKHDRETLGTFSGPDLISDGRTRWSVDSNSLNDGIHEHYPPAAAMIVLKVC